MITLTSYRIPAGILMAEMGGEQVLLNSETGTYHLVNATGRALLNRMDAGNSLEDAILALSEESGEPAENIRSDAAAFTADMMQRGLLERISQTSG